MMPDVIVVSAEFATGEFLRLLHKDLLQLLKQ